MSRIKVSKTISKSCAQPIIGCLNQVVGFHAVCSLLRERPEIIELVYVRDNLSVTNKARTDELLALAREKAVKLAMLTTSELKDLVKTDYHQGVVAVVNNDIKYQESDLVAIVEQHPQDAFILILDGVCDPHNLGACIRSANAFGVHAVVIPKDRACSFTPTVAKAAAGAAIVTPVIPVVNLARTMRFLKERHIWLYGAAEEASECLYDLNLTPPLAVVMGSEGNGLRRLTREHCDLIFKIPTKGAITSLNVSVATGVCLFEVVRGQHFRANKQ